MENGTLQAAPPSTTRSEQRRKKHGQTRITNGKVLLPTASGSSIWARLVRDTLGNLMSHLGGADMASETQKLASRRVSVLEAELIYLEDTFATARQEGRVPDANMLDLYGRLADRQRRLSAPLGWRRTPRDLGPSFGELLRADHARQQKIDAAEAEEKRRAFEEKQRNVQTFGSLDINAEQVPLHPNVRTAEHQDD
jgi:hypothetical protein